MTLRPRPPIEMFLDPAVHKPPTASDEAGALAENPQAAPLPEGTDITDYTGLAATTQLPLSIGEIIRQAVSDPELRS